MLALTAACSTPTLPLPPPTASIAAADADGQWLVEGTALETAFVFVFNEDSETGVIVIADDVGRFEAVIAAQPRHTVSVWQRSGNDLSPALRLTVPELR